MDRSSSGYRVAVYGKGELGTLLAEVLGIPCYSRGDKERQTPSLALICWPAHAMVELISTFPELKKTRTVSFCNGVWGGEVADEEGIAYVRAGAGRGQGSWRVEEKSTAGVLKSLGLNVACSRDHRPYVWGKALYLIPLAFACHKYNLSARDAVETSEWRKWLRRIHDLGIKEVGKEAMKPQFNRATWLVKRSPKGWKPSSSKEELDFFSDGFLGLEQCTK